MRAFLNIGSILTAHLSMIYKCQQKRVSPVEQNRTGRIFTIQTGAGQALVDSVPVCILCLPCTIAFSLPLIEQQLVYLEILR